MSEIVISQTIRIIIGLIVVVLLVFGFALYFNNNVLGLFDFEKSDSVEIDLSGYKTIPIEESSHSVVQKARVPTGRAKLNFVPIRIK